MQDKGISLTILGIVAVIAIVGLVLLFSKATTGQIIIGQPGQVTTWGKAIRTVSATRSCFLSTGPLGTVKTNLEILQAKVPIAECEPYSRLGTAQQEYCCPTYLFTP